jgi:hypothetical protein
MRRIPMTLLLAAAALPASAEGFGTSILADPYRAVAQLTQQERREMLQLWEQANPEQRLQLRREFQDRMHQERNGGQSGGGQRQDERGQYGDPRNAQEFRPPMPFNWGDFGIGFERRQQKSGQRGDDSDRDDQRGGFWPGGGR